MDRSLRLHCAFSPCPNDTFIFDALLHHRIPFEGIELKAVMEDVETLNQAAGKARYEISKLSFAALGHLRDTYALLRSGGALGRGCGPLVVARPGFTLTDLSDTVIAVPGRWTTAHLLLTLFSGKPLIVRAMPFDRIMPMLQNETIDIGVIIHESRFTYENYGLVKLVDLGEWWEQTTGFPIPLGGIAVRRDIPIPIAAKIEDAISRSVQYAMRHPEASRDFVRRHAQEMDPEIAHKHINLYVNNFSINMGREGEDAARYLFEQASAKGLLPESTQPLFATESFSAPL